MSRQVERTVVRTRVVDVWNEVPLVGQTTGMSCWAAAAAMLVGWREALPVQAEEIARGAGQWQAYQLGLRPRSVPELARIWKLVIDGSPEWTPDGVAAFLAEHGPLWIGEASPGLHAIVLTGLSGDGTDEGTQVFVNDPWPIGRGERYRLSFAALRARFDAAAAAAGPHARVLHSGGRGRGARTFRHIDRLEARMDRFPHEHGRAEAYGTEDAYEPVEAQAIPGAGHRWVRTTGLAGDPLVGHGATRSSNLFLQWDLGASGEIRELDVIVHLHGYSSQGPETVLQRAKIGPESPSGPPITTPDFCIADMARALTRRAGAVFAVPRGLHGGGSSYTFPSLNGGGLERFVRWTLDWIARENGQAPGSIRPRRVAIAAHSGGGSAADAILMSPRQREVDEVFLIDAEPASRAGDGVQRWLVSRYTAGALGQTVFRYVHQRGGHYQPAGDAWRNILSGATPFSAAALAGARVTPPTRTMPAASSPNLRSEPAAHASLSHGTIPIWFLPSFAQNATATWTGAGNHPTFATAWVPGRGCPAPAGASASPGSARGHGLEDSNRDDPDAYGQVGALDFQVAAAEHYSSAHGAGEPLASHAFSRSDAGPSLYLRWNAFAAPAQPTIDVVLHLHGWSGQGHATVLRAKIAQELRLEATLGGRTRPTLVVVPRGLPTATTAEQRAQHYPDWKYTFPALLRSGGVQALIQRALATFTAQSGLPTTPTIARFILAGHSGGGAPVNTILANRTWPGCNPHEVWMFDGTYGTLRAGASSQPCNAGYVGWLRERVAAGANAGALRVFYVGGGTANCARDLARHVDAVAPASSAHRNRYRVEQVRLGHAQVPATLFNEMLRDSTADVSVPRTVRAVALGEIEGEEEAYGNVYVGALGAVDDARAFLAGANPHTTPFPAAVASWIADTTASAIELIADATKRARHLTGTTWSGQHFPGNATPSDRARVLLDDMAVLIPERRPNRGPGAFPAIGTRVPPLQAIPGARGHRLYPAAADAFVRMRDQAAREGITLVIGSSYRSPSRQAGIAARNNNRQAVASNSTHVYGLAVDLHLSMGTVRVSEITTRPFTNIVDMYRSPIYKWLALRAKYFGFFPFRNEPWHWEYNPNLQSFRDAYTRDVFGAGSTGHGLAYGTPLGLFDRFPAGALGPADEPTPDDTDGFGAPVARPVRDAGQWPHAAVCRVLAQLPDGRERSVSAFWIAPGRLLTAATAVCDEGGRRPRRLRVIPARGAAFDLDPRDVRMHPRYASGQSGTDLAVLGAPAAFGDPGDATFEVDDASSAPAEYGCACGHAADGRLMSASGGVDRLLGSTAAGVGGPVYVLDGQRAVAIGVASPAGTLDAEAVQWIHNA